MPTQTFDIIGMTCSHCTAAVATELGAVPGVESVEVDLEAGRAMVTSTAALDRAVVRAAVDEAGYELAPES